MLIPTISGSRSFRLDRYGVNLRALAAARPPLASPCHIRFFPCMPRSGKPCHPAYQLDPSLEMRRGKESQNGTDDCCKRPFSVGALTRTTSQDRNQSSLFSQSVVSDHDSFAGSSFLAGLRFVAHFPFARL
ncbi:hypothetical protein DM860_008050 [Cuscuta australis]|uniref:Uncharacterized protein n=1 Tax=Cuscuta australis TaxID=267555 RepID=A0A328D490_9ASTE|nr:hypothetical protein DM860_008050 [Cuscuta australis]